MRARHQEHEADLATLLSLMENETIADHKRTISEQASKIAVLETRLAEMASSDGDLRRKVTDLETANEAQQKKLHHFWTKLDRATMSLDEVSTKLGKVTKQLKLELQDLQGERDGTTADLKKVRLVLGLGSWN